MTVLLKPAGYVDSNYIDRLVSRDHPAGARDVSLTVFACALTSAYSGAAVQHVFNVLRSKSGEWANDMNTKVDEARKGEKPMISPTDQVLIAKAVVKVYSR